MNKEESVKNRILFAQVGSHLYGTNTETSDTDFCGIFIGNKNMYFGLEPTINCDLSTIDKDDFGKNTMDAVDYRLYEIKNFVSLASKNNPAIMELLFVNDKNILFKNELGQMLMDNAELFPNKKAYDTFIGYSNSQKHKMVIKLENFDELTAAQEFFSKQDPNEYA